MYFRKIFKKMLAFLLKYVTICYTNVTDERKECFSKGYLMIMSFKKFMALMMAMTVLAGAFAGSSTSLAKKTKNTDCVVTGINTEKTGCVVKGISVKSDSDKGNSLVTVKESKTPLASAKKLLAEKKAEKAKEDKAKKKIAAQKKAAKKKYKKALRYLATIIYCEAGGQCYAGRLAVGAVVMNRVESPGYPNTIHGVLWQPYQFGPIRHGKMAREMKNYDKGLYKYPERSGSLKAAKDILDGKYIVKYNGKKINLRKYTNFNTTLSNAKIRISGHDFA